MLNSSGGPASGTRSRANSGKPKQTKTKPDLVHTGQKLLSDYFDNKSEEGTNKSTKLDFQKTPTLKQRSQSGNLYKTSILIPTSSSETSKKLKSGRNPKRLMLHNIAMSDSQYMSAPEMCSAEHESVELTTNPLLLSATHIKENEDNEVRMLKKIPLIHHTAGNTAVTTTVSTSNALNNLTPSMIFSSAIHTSTLADPQTFPMYKKGNASDQPQEILSTSTRNTRQIQMASKDDRMIEMLQNITAQLTTIQSDVVDLKSNKVEFAEQLAAVQFDQEDDHEVLVAQQNEMKVCKDQVGLLTDLVVRYEDKMEEMDAKISRLEARLMKSEIIIFGIIENQDESCITQANNFMKNLLLIPEPPAIAEAYWKGKSANKPMVIRFSDPSAKKIIYANTSNLKEKKNGNNKGYRVSDHLPEVLNEPQLRQRQIVAENKSLTGKNQLQLSYKKGHLHIHNEPYHKKVRKPGARSILNAEESELKDIKEIKVAGGHSETEGGSRFIVYACSVKDLQAVRRAYLHVRKIHADAHHVTMCFFCFYRFIS